MTTLKFSCLPMVCLLLISGCQTPDSQSPGTLQRQADRGNPEAQYELAKLYEKGEGVATNQQTAIDWYTKSAEQCYDKAQHALGYRYEKGEGVEQNMAKAAHWYSKAVEQDYASSQCNLGYCYETGQGVEKDIDEAARLYQLSANQSNKVAQANLGYCYLMGRGVEKDLAESFAWYRKSAEQDYARGQYSLGLRYLNGEGVEKNPELAVEWIRKAAGQDYPPAFVSLVYRYEKGEGVEQDLDEATRWYHKAMEHGYTRDLKKQKPLVDYVAKFSENDAKIRAINVSDSACTNYVPWMKFAIECKEELDLPHEIVPWLEELSTTFSNDWKILHAVAMGFDFAADSRGYDNSTGERCRWMALRQMDRAYSLLREAMPTTEERGMFFGDYFEMVVSGRDDNVHLLQLKTVDQSLKDVLSHSYGRELSREPVFFKCPEFYEAAANDGELARWLLSQQSMVAGRAFLQKHQAFFAFTLAGCQHGRPWKLDEESKDLLAGLADDQSVVWKDDTPEIIDLPADYAFIPVFQNLAKAGDKKAASFLALICKNRFQLERAAKYYEMAGDTNMVRSIRAPQGTIEDCPPQSAGVEAKIAYRYRNGNEVEVSVFRLNAGTNLLVRLQNGEVKHGELNLLRGYPVWFREDGCLEKPGVLEAVAKWTVELAPHPGHRDSTKEIVFQPLEAGNYLVRTEMKDGNYAVTFLNIYGAMLYSGTLSSSTSTNVQNFFLLCDAFTGKPLPNEPVHFLELSGGRIRDKNRKMQNGPLVVDRYAGGRTDADGRFVFEERVFGKWAKDLHVLARLDTPHPLVAESDNYDRRFYESQQSGQATFVGTDRPIYRPGDVGHLKLWKAGDTNSSMLEISGGRSKFKLPITSSTKVAPDGFGGADADFSIPTNTPPGEYAVKEMLTEDDGVECATLRVEHYRTPEFEVSVRQLDGGKIEIRADYAYGQPVVGGKVEGSVRFEKASPQPWHPGAAFDGVWGKGYWWHGGQLKTNIQRDEWQFERDHFSFDIDSKLDAEGRLVIDLAEQTGGAEALETTGYISVSASVVDAAQKRQRTTERFANNMRKHNLCCWLDQAFYEPADQIVCRVDASKAVAEIHVELFRMEGTNVVPVLQKKATGKQVDFGALEPGLYEAKATAKDELDSEPFRFFVLGGAETSLSKGRPIRVVREKGVYNSGETASILVQVDQPGRYVYFFERVTGRNTFLLPKAIYMDSVSKRIPLSFAPDEAGMLQCAAMTVVDGRMSIEGCTIPVVEYSKESGTVEIKPDKPVCRPGETVTLDIQALGVDGKGKQCAVAVSVYNKVLDSVAEGVDQRSILLPLFSSWQYRAWPSLRLHDGWPSYIEAEAPSWVMRSLDNARNSGIGAADDLFGDSLASDVDIGFSMPEINFFGLRSAAEPAPAMALRKRVEPYGAAGVVMEGGAVSIREDFRDAAYWNALVETDADGKATVEFPVPDSLTEWKVVAWAMHTNYAASGEASIQCAKDFVLQLNTPRFLIEGDELEVSGSLRNHSTNMLEAVASCTASGAVLRVESDSRVEIQSLEPAQERMLYWKLQAAAEGTGTLAATAKSSGESDGMARPIPVLPHGMLKRGGRSGVLAGNRREERVEINIPDAIGLKSLKFELNCTPNMLESVAAALPYLAEYPHGCTEQTLNRFLPSVAVLQTLDKLGLEPDALAASMPADRKAVYDRAEIIKRTQAGIDKLRDAQGWDGWWCWNMDWSSNRSDPLVSAWVLRGFHMASKLPNLSFDTDKNIRGLNKMIERMELLMKPAWRQSKKLPITNTDAMLALVAQEIYPEANLKKPNLDRVQKVLADFTPFLLKHADELSFYGKVMLAYVFELQGDAARCDELLRFIEQYLETDPELGTYWLRTASPHWWFWYNDPVEIQAWYLKLLNRMEPDSAKAAGVARYLMINRMHGDHWKSTRDTAICIEALCEFIVNNRPEPGDDHFEVLLNGGPMGDGLKTGKNELVLKTDGSHPLFYDSTWQYYTRENSIASEKGDLVSVSRAYYRIDLETGMRLDEPLSPGTELKAGETIEAVLKLEAPQELEYLLAQDFKPSGFECLETDSGWRRGNLGHYQEIHNERVSFYIDKLPMGSSTIEYRMRPEHAGKMSALPATVELMYAPRQAANTDEDKLRVLR